MIHTSRPRQRRGRASRLSRNQRYPVKGVPNWCRRRFSRRDHHLRRRWRADRIRVGCPPPHRGECIGPVHHSARRTRCDRTSPAATGPRRPAHPRTARWRGRVRGWSHDLHTRLHRRRPRTAPDDQTGACAFYPGGGPVVGPTAYDGPRCPMDRDQYQLSAHTSRTPGPDTLVESVRSGRADQHLRPGGRHKYALPSRPVLKPARLSSA
jgi:hypothetical protein